MEETKRNPGLMCGDRLSGVNCRAVFGVSAGQKGLLSNYHTSTLYSERRLSSPQSQPTCPSLFTIPECPCVFPYSTFRVARDP